VKSEPGTYALILQNRSTGKVQIGRLGQIELVPGYYIYVGSAFGPGGVRARVSRHWRADKPKHWHIDHLREFVPPLSAWVSYKPEQLEHQWAQRLYETSEMEAIQGFGCSDCKCYSHLFYTAVAPENTRFDLVDSIYCYAFDKSV
jgi:Uri superfamily endonuclease